MGFVDKIAFKNARTTFFLKSGKAGNIFRMGLKKLFLRLPEGCMSWAPTLILLETLLIESLLGEIIASLE